MTDKETIDYNYYKKDSLIGIFIKTLREKGIFYSFKKALLFIEDIIIGRLLFLIQKRKFTFNGKELQYFLHRYNKTWKNERAIELPVFISILEDNKPKKILEVGHVLGHYINTNHGVLDKYEKGEGIMNADAVDFVPKSKYDLILSVSTMEHIGIDDYPQNPRKAVIALKNLQKNSLTNKGKMIISFPSNYNKSLMSLAENSKKIKIFCFKRYDKGRNLWTQTDFPDIKDLNTSPPEAIIFMEINKKSSLSENGNK